MQPRLFARHFIAFSILMTAPAICLMSQGNTTDSEDDVRISLHRGKPAEMNWLTPETPENNIATSRKTLNAFNIKAVRDFIKRYGEQKTEKWIASNEGYLVVFTSNEELTKVRYTSAGKWINTIRQYDKKAMSKELKEDVEEIFGSCTIVVIYEFSTPLLRETISYIHLKHASKYKILKVIDNQIEEIQVMNLQTFK